MLCVFHELFGSCFRLLGQEEAPAELVVKAGAFSVT